MALKKPFKVLILFFSISIVCFALASVYVLTRGRAMILTELEKRLGDRPEISSLYIVFPASIVVEDFAIGENLRIDKIIIAPSLLGFFKGDIVINSCILDKPYLKMTRRADESFDFGIELFRRQGGSVSPVEPSLMVEKDDSVSLGQLQATEKAKRKYNFFLKRLKINNATVDFIDEAVIAGGSFHLRMDHFCLNVSQASFLEKSRMRLDVLGSLKSQQGDAIGDVKLAGWFDFLSRDMDIKAHVKDVRLAYLGPYCLRSIKRELSSGNMMFSADLKSDKNDLKADCHVELDQLVFKGDNQTLEKNSLGISDFAGLAFNSVLSAQGKIIFDFFVRTKMDHPRFENVRFKGAFFENGIKAVVAKGPQIAAQLATGGAEETIGDFKEVGKKFEDFGRQFKDMFKKD